jgi:hypothetical protein
VNALWPSLVLAPRRLVSGLTAASLLLVTGASVAQPAPPGAEPAPVPTAPDGPAPASPPSAAPGEPPPPSAPAPLAESPLVKPKIDLTVPEPTPSIVRKHHNHDGFYLRANVGFSWSRAEVSNDAPSQPNYVVNGGGISIDFLVGATPSPSLAVGGGVMLNTISDPEVHLDNDADVGSGSGGVLFVGPFVDGFPMSNGGLHLGALVGFAGGTARRQGSDDDFCGGGLGGAAWVGQGFWVGSEVSLGFLLKLDAAFMRDGSGPVDLSNTLYGGSLMFSVLYH